MLKKGEASINATLFDCGKPSKTFHHCEQFHRLVKACVLENHCLAQKIVIKPKKIFEIVCEDLLRTN